MSPEDSRRKVEKERSAGSSHDTRVHAEKSIYRSPTSNIHGELNLVKLTFRQYQINSLSRSKEGAPSEIYIRKLTWSVC